jgi:tetratricopeptide (TPR) repeat protein
MLNEAAITLRPLGRLTEALEPVRATIEINAAKSQWKNAAVCASNLSELELTLGEVAAGVEEAEQSVTYADSSGTADWQSYVRTRATYAGALHLAGRRAEAEARFREAEKMQAKRQPDYPLLYSVRGFQYCDLILTDAERAAWWRCLPLNSYSSTLNHLESYRTVGQRAAQTLKWAEALKMDNLSSAIDHLTLGRNMLYRVILEHSDFRLLTADC